MKFRQTASRLVVFGIISVSLCAFADRYIDIADPGFEGGDPSGKKSWALRPPWRIAPGEGINGSGGLVWETDDTNLYVCAVQEIPVVPGGRYRYEAAVRLEDFRSRRGHGVSMAIEWTDAEGKYLGGGYAQSVMKPEGCWLELTGSTRKVSENAAKGRIVLIVNPGCTGKVTFDNVGACIIEDAPVAGVYSDAYRDEAAEGLVTFHASLAFPDGTGEDDVKAFFTYRRPDGTQTRVPADSRSRKEASVKIPVEAMAPGIHPVVCELVRGSGEVLGRAECAFSRVRVLPDRKVRIDRHRRVTVDGKPFFPFGMYYGSVQKDSALLDVYAAGPFNCVLPYEYIDRKGMDMLHERGLKLIFACGQRWWNSPRGVRRGYKSAEEADKVFISEMNMLKDHPAFLGYNVADESPLTYLDGEKHVYGLIRKHDPDHPAWSVCAVFDQVRDFMPAYDVAGTDPYPVSRRPMRYVTDGVRAAVRGTFGTRSVWQVLQAFSWGWQPGADKSVDYRFPTEQDFRNMFWQSINGGANGIVLFFFREMRRHCENFDADWAALCRAGEEVKRLMPVILSVEEAPSVEGLPEPLTARTWIHDGHLYLSVAEIAEKPVSAELGISSGKWRLCGTEVGPAQRMTAPDSVRVELPALGVSVLKFEPCGKDAR